MKLGNLTRKHVPNKHWPKEKKIEAVVQWLALGNLKLVAASTGVSYGMLKQWRIQPWWKEYEAEIRNTENLKLDKDMTKIVERSLEVIADRMEHGDHVYDNKTGQIRRKPVTMKDAAKVSVDLLTKRELLRGNATSRSESTQIPVQEQLKLLAEQFAMMTKNPQLVIDADVVDVTPKEETDEDLYEVSDGDSSGDVQGQTDKIESDLEN